jgi:hypothetical protein
MSKDCPARLFRFLPKESFPRWFLDADLRQPFVYDFPPLFHQV